MLRFATYALFAGLIACPLFAQDAGESREAGKPAPAEDREALTEREAPVRDRKAPEPGAPAAPRRPQPPDGNKLVAPPPVVPAPAMLAILPADARVSPFGDGVLVLESGAAGDRFVSYDADGKVRGPVRDAGGKVERWWVSPDSEHLTWVSGGHLWTVVPAAKMLPVDLGDAPAGAPALSPDGKRFAFVRNGKLVVVTADGQSPKEIGAADGLLLGGGAAWSLDGKKVFALVGAAANEPDGIGAADLTGEAPSVARVYQATNATLSTLALSPNGLWLMFVQTGRNEPRQSALRLLSPDGSEFRTLARAPGIEDAVFAPDGLHAYFSGRAANGLWQAWECGLEPDVRTGEIPVRRIVEEENRQFLRPVVGRDGGFAWFVRQDAGGKGAEVGKVKLR
ncbi:MAG: PD40 domain-containing protein [Planctomycetia bacterium]|nr:PD40 domain-containing protein [Planctomycetia bacterium]